MVNSPAQMITFIASLSSPFTRTTIGATNSLQPQPSGFWLSKKLAKSTGPHKVLRHRPVCTTTSSERTAPTNKKPSVLTIWFGIVASITSIPTLLLMLVMFPFLYSKRRQIHANLLRLSMRIVFFLSGIRLRTEGLKNLKEGSLLVANRQSAFDMFVLATLPTAPRVIVPSTLMRVPVLGWLFALAGFIPLRGNSRADATRALENASEMLTSGASIAVFPEAKPGPSGTVSRFLSQPFRLAQTGAPVLPVCVTGGCAICKDSSFPVTSGSFVVSIQSPVTSATSEKNLAKETFDSINAGMPEEFRSEGWSLAN